MSEKKEIDVTPENESDLIKGLIEAADYKVDVVRNITIEREAGKPLFSFKIHPLSSEDVQAARKRATTYMPNPQNPKLPPVVKSTSDPDFLAWEIYLASEGETGSKIWDNKELKESLKKKDASIHTNIDIIKAVMTAGEIVQVSNVIDDISGDNSEVVDYAKN